jgi:alcohol dehydrogenase class IV
MAEVRLESIFTMDTSAIKFGVGATAEVGSDLAVTGSMRAMLVTDPNLANSEAVAIAERSLHEAGVEVVRYDEVRVEPTDRSFLAAIAAATESGVD